LERTLQSTVNDNELECTRLNTEIDRLNTILKATNGNMQDQLAKAQIEID